MYKPVILRLKFNKPTVYDIISRSAVKYIFGELVKRLLHLTVNQAF